MCWQQDIRAFGGGRLATALGVTPQAVSYWLKKGRIPPCRVPDVERVTGIDRHVLCPMLWEPPASEQRAAA